MLRVRLLQVKILLSDRGSVWVHCDDSEQHRLRCVMDEVFGPENFVGAVLVLHDFAGSADSHLDVRHDERSSVLPPLPALNPRRAVSGSATGRPGRA